MNPLKDPADCEEATRTVNEYAQSDWTRLSFSTHALEQMKERSVPDELVVEVLSNGRCVGIRSEVKAGRLVYGYEMVFRDPYGVVTVVTAIPGFHCLHVITAYTDTSD